MTTISLLIWRIDFGGLARNKVGPETNLPFL
jgi:hypothetical protein